MAKVGRVQDSGQVSLDVDDLQAELEFERQRANSAQAELLALRKQIESNSELSRDAATQKEALYDHAVEECRRALRSNIFETLRWIQPARSTATRRLDIIVPWAKISPASVAHVSCCEAHSSCMLPQAADYVGVIEGARPILRSAICGNECVVVDVEFEEPSGAALMVNVTLMGTPEQHMLGNSGVSSLEQVRRVKEEYVVNFIGMNDGDDVDFVKSLYHRFLGRSPDDSGLKANVGVLRHRGATRMELALSFLDSPEFASRIL